MPITPKSANLPGLVVCLTGGIGSGKSVITAHLATLGVPIIDADVIARELVQPLQPALQELVAAFGPKILTTDGLLDRAALHRRVFTDAVAKSRVEAILHPRIRAAMQAQLQLMPEVPYVVLVVPLLFETGQTDYCQRILVVDSSESAQVARVQLRDGHDIATVQAVMAVQWDRQRRCKAADDIITNDGDIMQLKANLDVLHQHYITMGKDNLVANARS